MSGPGGKGDILTALTAGRVVFDATVPLYLSELGQSATLAGAFRDRALIPGGVFRELDGLSHHGFPAAETLLRPRPFARVVELSGDELEDVIKRQRRWNGERAYEDPTEDRGEAECLQLCMRDVERTIALCAHDHKVRNDPDSRGITMLDAVSVCLLFALRGTAADAAWRLYTDLVRRGMNEVRHFPPDRRGEHLFAQVVDASRRRLDLVRSSPMTRKGATA
ncbi:MAG: hypothetical protein M0Z49_00255 [Chloroflexi bacterium]|nr:hypothetical protein [Chloroflexota bacterium]